MPTSEPKRPDFDLIYARHAAEYHELVAAEDWRGNLPKAIRRIVDPAGRTVVELGAGTGRVTALVAPGASRVLAFDRSRSMLDQAEAGLSRLGISNVALGIADNRAVPLPDGSADIVIEGWSFGHTVSVARDAWRGAAEGLIRESERLLVPGGTLILIETLGTGFRMPTPPGDILPVFFGFLERQLGFTATWIRTDYRFSSLVEARRLVEFFFVTMTDYELGENASVIVPECTGIWWRKKLAGHASRRQTRR